jgi:hypothetical protein
MRMIGNVLFFKKTNSFISRIISSMTNGEYTHVGLIIDYSEETNIATIIESDKFVNTRIAKIQISELHTVYEVDDMTELIRENVVKFAIKSIGEKYDYLQIIGLFVSLLLKRNRYAFFNAKNKMICSELIDMAYLKAGVKRKNSLNIGYITPQELLDVYELKVVRKGA